MKKEYNVEILIISSGSRYTFMKKYLHAIILFLWLSLGMSALHAAPINIMPLGDSITYDSKYGDTRSSSVRTGYRSHLWYKLQDVNFEANFVGSKIAGEAVIPSFDPHNEGHPGWNQFEIAEETDTYMSNSKPDIVLLHIGTNDTTTNPAGIDDILSSIDLYESESQTTVDVYVALIIDREHSDPRITAFNNRLAELLVQRINTGDNIIIVNMFKNAHLTGGDYADETHPNDSGYAKMANVWFDALTTSFNPTLSAFPYTVLAPSSIVTTSTDTNAGTINIIANVPTNGITF